MSTRRFGRSQKAITLLPLALLSAAWTAGLAAPVAPIATVAEEVTGVLPDGTTVPTEAIEAPASLSEPGAVAPGVPAGRGADAVRAASTNAIPAAALAAYQRAETVINRADAGCNITWPLVAAIGRVESDHGRFGGNVLDSDGVAQPGIRGIALDGSNNTAAIPDTDAGQLDGDRRWDRAVGPMQFIPSTWSVVGVDADGDGKRDPQDIDDAALASAVYLCSGNEDLSTTPGQRSAVFRYNNSEEYVDLVLAIMEAYSQGDFTSVPTATASGETLQPDPSAAPEASGPAPGGPRPGGSGSSRPSAPSPDADVDSPAPDTGGSTGSPGGSTPGGGNTGGSNTGGGNTGGGNGGGNGGDGNGNGNGGGTGNGGGNNGSGGGNTVPKNPTKPVEDVLTYAEARVKCLGILNLSVSDLVGGVLNGAQASKNKAKLEACIARELG